MFATNTLIELYRLEKAALDLPTEPFPSFGEWKAEYEADWARTHHTVSEEEAEAMLEAEITEADELFEQLNAKPVVQPVVDVVKEVKPARAPKATKKPKNYVKLKSKSKREVAEDMFVEMNTAGAARKDVIQAFMDKIKLTKNGASTYYANCKKKFS